MSRRGLPPATPPTLPLMPHFAQPLPSSSAVIKKALRSPSAHRTIKEKCASGKASNLILFLVDASWSMAVAERMQATKGAIMSLLTDAYQRRDRVGLVVFQKDQARVVLPPTNSVGTGAKGAQDIPVGGKTPLSAGLNLAHKVIQQNCACTRT